MSANDNRQGKRLAWISASVIALVCLGGVAAFYYQDHLLRSRLSMAADARTIKTDRAVNGDTPFHEHVVQAGVTACGAAFPAMGKLLTQNSQYMVQTRWHRQEPERHMIAGLVGMQFDLPDYKGPAVGYVFAAPGDGSCSGGMVRVTPFAQNCEAVTRHFLSRSTPAAELQGLRTYVEADGSHVVVMPFGENCVAVSVGDMPG